MKKAFVTLCILLVTAATAFAGGDKNARYYTPKFTQGWFIDLAGTYSIFAANGSAYHDLATYYGEWPAGTSVNGKYFIGGSVKLGRRVSPSIALRAGYDLHRSGNQYGNFRYKSVHFDVMESPLDLLFGYNPDRFYTLWVYGGMGVLAYDHGTQGLANGYLPGWTSNLEFGFNGGFVNSFRISNSIDFHIDLTATAFRWSFDDTYMDNVSLWHRMHFDFTAEAGFMWYLGGRRFTQAVETVVPDCTEQENRIKELNGELAQLRKELENCTGGSIQVPDTVVKIVNGDGKLVTYPFSIFFNKGSYELRDGRDRVNLESIAKAAKDNNLKINLRGTCDSGTGSAAFNKTLAQNRCNKIKNELTKMGVPADNITIETVGGVKELSPAEYDRRVLLQLSK